METGTNRVKREITKCKKGVVIIEISLQAGERMQERGI